MRNRSYIADLTGSEESLDDLLTRLKLQLSRPKARPGRDIPPDFGHFVTSRRPKGGSGGAEAPMPKPDHGLADACAAY